MAYERGMSVTSSVDNAAPAPFSFEYKIQSTSFLKLYDKDADVFFTDVTHYLKAVTVLPIGEKEVHEKFNSLESDDESETSVNLVESELLIYNSRPLHKDEYFPDNSLDYLEPFGIKKLDYIKLKVGYSYSKPLLREFYKHRRFTTASGKDKYDTEAALASQEDPLVLRMIKQRFITTKELEKYKEKYYSNELSKSSKIRSTGKNSEAFDKVNPNITSKRVRKTGQFHFGNILGSIIPNFDRTTISIETAKNLKEISVIELQLPDDLIITWPEEENMFIKNEVDVETFESTKLNKEVFNPFTTMDVFRTCDDQEDEDVEIIKDKLTEEKKHDLLERRRKSQFDRNRRRLKNQFKNYTMTRSWSVKLIDWITKETERINKVYMCDINRNAKKLIPRLLGMPFLNQESKLTNTEISGTDLEDTWQDTIFPEERFKKLVRNLNQETLDLLANTLNEEVDMSHPEVMFKTIRVSIDPYIVDDDVVEISQTVSSLARQEMQKGWTCGTTLKETESDEVGFYNESAKRKVHWTRSQEKCLYNEKEECEEYSNDPELTIDQKLARLSYNCINANCLAKKKDKKQTQETINKNKGKDINKIENRLKKYSKMLSVLFKQNEETILHDFVMKSVKTYDTVVDTQNLVGFKKEIGHYGPDMLNVIRIDDTINYIEFKDKNEVETDSGRHGMFSSMYDRKKIQLSDYDLGSDMSESPVDFEDHDQIEYNSKTEVVNEETPEKLCRYKVKKTKPKKDLHEEIIDEQVPMNREFLMKRLMGQEKMESSRGKSNKGTKKRKTHKIHAANETDYDFEISEFLKYELLDERNETEKVQKESVCKEKEESLETVEAVECLPTLPMNEAEVKKHEPILDSEFCSKLCRGVGKGDYYEDMCFAIKDLPSSVDVKVSNAILYETLVEKKKTLDAERLTSIALLHLYVKINRLVLIHDKRSNTPVYALTPRLKDYCFLYALFTKHICGLSEFYHSGHSVTNSWLQKRVQDLELACPLFSGKPVRIPVLYNSIIRFPFIRHLFINKIFKECDFEIKQHMVNFEELDPNKNTNKCLNNKINSSCILPMMDNMILKYGSLVKFLKYCMDLIVLHYIDTQRFYSLKDIFEKDAESQPILEDHDKVDKTSTFDEGLDCNMPKTQLLKQNAYFTLIKKFCLATGNDSDFKNFFNSDFSIEVIRDMTVQQMANIFIDNELSSWPLLNTSMVTKVVESVHKILSASAKQSNKEGKGVWIIPHDLDPELVNDLVRYFNRYLRYPEGYCDDADLGVVTVNPALPSLTQTDQRFFNKLVTRALLFKLLNDS